MESFCLSGASHHTCHSINIKTDPIHYDKNVLYDLNLNDPFAKTIEQYKYSINIGDNLGKLHSSEMDFAAHNSQIGGFLIGQVDVTIEWYLMTTRQIPNGRCTLDPSCLVTKKTTSGFFDFGNTRLKENGMFYLCAIVPQTINIHSITVCSDGFLIDESLPEKGVVVIESTNGYLIEGSEMTLHWSGFHGNHQAEIIGYPSDIAYYQYAVGMFIHTFGFNHKYFKSFLHVKEYVRELSINYEISSLVDTPSYKELYHILFRSTVLVALQH